MPITRQRGPYSTPINREAALGVPPGQATLKPAFGAARGASQA